VNPLGAVAGMLGAVSFGVGDFAGASAARRAPTLVVVAGAHAIGLLALLVAAAVLRPPLPGADGIALGLAAGVAGVVGLAALYRGMSLGSMGLITSLSGAGALALPLVVGSALGATMSPMQLAGVACAAAAAGAAGGATADRIGRAALVLAGLAAASFGAWYVLIDLAARAADPLWALVLSRAGSAAIAATAATVAGVGGRGIPVALIIVAGLFDVGGNALYVVAREHMHVGLAAALVGCYPVVTMLMARLVIGERLPRLGQAGVALALVGIVLISLGA
jgi:drug/metabolite transporter (DMT)-like permease